MVVTLYDEGPTPGAVREWRREYLPAPSRRMIMCSESLEDRRLWSVISCGI
jgi:hypothetical protein